MSPQESSCSTVSPRRETTLAVASGRGFEELDSRRGDGIEVSMMWERSSNRVLVAVLDRKHGRYFEIPLKPGQRALEVFRHPFVCQPAPSVARSDAMPAADRE